MWLKIKVDLLGILTHSLPSFAASFKPEVLPSLTMLFSVYQLIDYLEGERPEEVMGDIVEFSAGIVAGFLVSLVL